MDDAMLMGTPRSIAFSYGSERHSSIMFLLSIRLPASPPLLHFQFSSFATNSELKLIRTASSLRCTIPMYAPVVVGRRLSSSFVCCSSNCTGKIPRPFCSPSPLFPEASSRVMALLFRLVACAVLFAGFRAPAFAVCLASVLPTIAAVESDIPSTESPGSAADGVEDEELRAAFEQWKSKIFALTVPLRIIALQGSMPPFWIKEFVQTQGKRLKMNIVLRSSLESIYSELNLALDKGFLHPKSAMAADLVSLGDSWLGNAIQRGLIECIPNIEEQDWFMSLGNKWKVHLSRNMKGELDPSGNIWGVPYRWGTMVIAYKKCKFNKHNLAPIKDWDDLWRPELTGKISMIDSPRRFLELF
ncbi:hypothetical protein HPP92_014663 [Vanilla planifolia]|uniref:Uncharacterized protein n=1 Tax=Vanilla planifolia TaxID=51239 RepID=A0A835QUB9_VANPL|nr:hypothetical protein HPP92_014663 [Vanilla planifolia]